MNDKYDFTLACRLKAAQDAALGVIESGLCAACLSPLKFERIEWFRGIHSSGPCMAWLDPEDVLAVIGQVVWLRMYGEVADRL
jgi:hypothetical protein